MTQAQIDAAEIERLWRVIEWLKTALDEIARTEIKLDAEMAYWEMKHHARMALMPMEDKT